MYARVGYRWRRSRRSCWRLNSDEAVLSCERQVLDAALWASSRRCTHAAEPNPLTSAGGRRGRRPCMSRACLHLLCSPHRAGYRVKRDLLQALQRPHGQQRTASLAGRWGRCWARIDGAFGRTARELCSARAVRLDPCSSSDVLTRLPSQSRGKRNVGLLEVGFLCCIPNAQALSSFIDRPSPLAFRARGESKGRPRVPRLPRFVVRCRGP